jgi:peroxiredoxin
VSDLVGQPAPDFTLTNQYGQKVTLSDFRGVKNVLLMFYPAAFTSTCTAELCALRDRAVDFENDDTAVLSVSCDNVGSLKAYSMTENLTHSLLSDFWPHGEVSRAYGVFIEPKGVATRGSFVIDKAGVVRWAVVNHPREARRADEYAAVLASLV